MALDRSYEAAKKLVADVRERLDAIATEQDARLQLINRFLTEVLDWEFGAIKTETFSDAGFADYLVGSGENKHMVVEAKRTGSLLLDTHNPKMKSYKVGGPALESAADGVKQANAYCLEHGVNYAVITTGLVWIAYIPMPGGRNYRDGSAFVFPNLDAIIDNFSVFYELFSKEAVTSKLYLLLFAKDHGLTMAELEPLIPAIRREEIHIEAQSALASDLTPVFQQFFGAMSSENNKEMLIECFVETRESRFADASLEKIVKSVTASIAALSPTAENQLAREIQGAVEAGRGETVVIVGNAGAGKSTFMERFFESVLEPVVRSKCLVVSIDLKNADADMATLSSWLTKTIREELEKQLYTGGFPTYDQLRGLYFSEYQKWASGTYKPLYESDKLAFQNKFSDYLNEAMTRDPHSYVLKILEDVVKNRKLLPCLIFDNGDHFDLKFQEAVFQYSQAIRQKNPLAFVVMPVSDRSFWRLSKAGPFQAYPSKMFYLPVPPAKDVLERRVNFLRRKISEESQSEGDRKYFLTKGIKLKLDDIQGFAATLEEIFLNEDFVSRRISWLANNNISRSLVLTQRVILSPHFKIDNLVSAYLTHRLGERAPVDYQNFMHALLRDQYSAFQQDRNAFVQNVFAVSPKAPASPLLILSIIKMLIDRAGEDSGGIGAYMTVDQCRQYFEPMMVGEVALLQALYSMLDARLIEPYDASDDTVEDKQRVAVSYAGRMHYEMATTEPFFIDELAWTTPVRSVPLVEALRALRTKRTQPSERAAELERRFVEYCLDQDRSFMNVPSDPIYEGQRQLRSDLSSRWIKSSVSEKQLSSGADSVPTTQRGHSYLPVVVKWFDPDRNYGFVEGGLGQDIFIHQSALQAADIEVVEQGDKLVCDVASAARGKLQVIAVHSHTTQDQSDWQGRQKRLVVHGVVEHFQERKGFGFVKTLTLPEDVFFSVDILDRATREALEPGVSVRLEVASGKYGRGYMATSLVLDGDEMGGGP